LLSGVAGTLGDEMRQDETQLVSSQRTDPAPHAAQLGSRLWDYGWGALFVILMTLLSMFGPRTEYLKNPATAQAATQPAAQVTQ
jgi:hypothetical protein